MWLLRTMVSPMVSECHGCSLPPCVATRILDACTSSGGVTFTLVSMYRPKTVWLLFNCTSTLPMYCDSSDGRVRLYCTRPHSSCGCGRRAAIARAAGLMSAGSTRLLTKGARNVTLRAQVAELNVEKSPRNIAAVGTNA